MSFEEKFMRLKKFLALFFALFIFLNNISFAVEITNETKYPDYSELYVGKDKLEKFNRKVFNFNLKLNEYFLKPIHVVWASIMPEYGMDRIYSMTKNIEYPIRLVSTLIQRDFKSAGTETVRFLTNTTIGLGGMFDPAKRIFKFKEVDENMEQALAKCKVKQGLYMVMPVFSSTTPRNMCGRLLDSVFNPSSYVGVPIIAAVKAIIMINRTYYLQPLVHMLETNFADCYDIAKKFYGLENYIKCSNFDRLNLIDKIANENKKLKVADRKLFYSHPQIVSQSQDENISDVALKGSAEQTEIILKNRKGEDDGYILKPDIMLNEYSPQSPVIDSMRTVMFEFSENYKSIWADFSVWNRAFNKSLKTTAISIYPNRPKYKYRYILQKDKDGPVAVIYPSIGDGSMSMHAAKFAKIFYDKGYSVVILSSHFNWEFAKSMPTDYFPGNPSVDVEYVKTTTDKILSDIETKYGRKFSFKTTVGTSFGALMTLYMAEKEYSKDTKDKYIAICPPVELVYAMNQVDEISEDWKNSSATIKDDVALTVEKLIQIFKTDESEKMKIKELPFSEKEAKLITGFLLHQKLSDLIYTKKHPDKKVVAELYDTISKTNYNDYVRENLLHNSETIKDLEQNSSLHKISTYLINANNYKIYHSVDDYLTNANQLKKLKMYSGTKSVYFSNGAHLGFLYRKEFLDNLKSEIEIRNN